MNKEQWFWNIIANAKEDRELLQTILMEFSKDNIVAFQEIFVDLAAELIEIGRASCRERV